MKKEDEFKIKAKIVNEVMDNIVNGVQELERNFIDDFGMTLDQFEKLDINDQKKIIERVSKVNKKSKIKSIFKKR